MPMFDMPSGAPRLRARLTLVGANGRRWELFDPSSPVVAVSVEGLTGLWVTGEDSHPTASWLGSRRPMLRGKTMEGSIVLTVREAPQREFVMRELRAAFRPDVPLSLTMNHGLGPVSARFVLVEPVAWPSRDPADDGDGDRSITVRLRGASDSTAWSTGVLSSRELTESGRVLVDNHGDYPLCPRLVWTGSGRVVMPSGAMLTLPAVTEPHTVFLDDKESFLVVDDHNRPALEVWKQVRGRVFAEPIPPGETKEYGYEKDDGGNSGAQFMWRLKVVDPWA